MSIYYTTYASVSALLPTLISIFLIVIVINLILLFVRIVLFALNRSRTVFALDEFIGFTLCTYTFLQPENFSISSKLRYMYILCEPELGNKTVLNSIKVMLVSCFWLDMPSSLSCFAMKSSHIAVVILQLYENSNKAWTIKPNMRSLSVVRFPNNFQFRIICWILFMGCPARSILGLKNFYDTKAYVGCGVPFLDSVG